MIQIIGWIACAMLAVKLCEIVSNPAMYGEDGRMRTGALMAQLIGWISIALFGGMLWLQGEQMASRLDNVYM